MIRSDRDRTKAAKRVRELRKLIEDHYTILGNVPEFTPAIIERSVAPLQEQLHREQEEIRIFDALKSGIFPHGPIEQMGVLLVQWRIARNITQKRLAEQLDIEESQVSRYERTEYRGVKFETIIKVTEALGLTIHLIVTKGCKESDE